MSFEWPPHQLCTDPPDNSREVLVMWSYDYPGDRHPTQGFCIGEYFDGHWHCVGDDASPETFVWWWELPETQGPGSDG